MMMGPAGLARLRWTKTRDPALAALRLGKASSPFLSPRLLTPRFDSHAPPSAAQLAQVLHVIILGVIVKHAVFRGLALVFTKSACLAAGVRDSTGTSNTSAAGEQLGLQVGQVARLAGLWGCELAENHRRGGSIMDLWVVLRAVHKSVGRASRFVAMGRGRSG